MNSTSGQKGAASLCMQVSKDLQPQPGEQPSQLIAVRCGQSESSIIS